MWPLAVVAMATLITHRTNPKRRPRNADIRSTTRSTTVIVSVRIKLSSWEPPIGIEPMTYALRGGLGSSTAVQAVTSALLAWLLSPPVSMMVQGRC
jgi:hypothetical protein